MPRLRALLAALLLCAPSGAVERKANIPVVPAIPAGLSAASSLGSASLGLRVPTAVPGVPALPNFALQPLESLVPREFAQPGPRDRAELPLVRGNAVASGRYVVQTLQPGSRVTPEAASSAVFDGLAARDRGVYYLAGSERLSGRALFEDLHRRATRAHRPLGYDQAKSALFKTVDQVIVDGKRGIIDAYSGVFVEGTGDDGNGYPEDGDDNGDGHVDRDGMNVEHIWPQSFFNKRNPMRGDLHHLMATFIHPNGVRGHLPFGVVRGRGDYSNDAGAKRGQGVFEPPDFTKGRVARAMLYFYARYHAENISQGHFGEDFWNSKIALLLDWNRRFPPDEFEKRRNDLVEDLQGNRNPFVDDPALADRIGEAALRRASRLSAKAQRRLANSARGR